MKLRVIIAAALLVSGIAVPAMAQAANTTSGRSEMQAQMSAKVSLGDAVKAAEAKASGKAVEAQFSSENGSNGYDVTVLASDGTEHDLFVDADSGKVAQAAPDKEQADENMSGDGHEENESANDGDQEDAD